MRSPARCQKKTSSSPPREREKDRSKKPCEKLTSKKREEKSLLNFREPRLTPLTRTFSSPRKQKKRPRNEYRQSNKVETQKLDHEKKREITWKSRPGKFCKDEQALDHKILPMRYRQTSFTINRQGNCKRASP
jgi:hypothetical protein